MASSLNEILGEMSPYKGVRCLVDLAACQLVLSSEPEDGSEETVFDLPAVRKLDEPVLHASDQGVCLLQPDKGEKRQILAWKPGLEYSLIAGQSGCFIEQPAALFEPFLLRSQYLIYPGSYTRRPAQGPYDLFVSADQTLLAVVSRLEAHVLVFDLQRREQIVMHQFEALQGPKAITVAFDTQWRTLWLAGADSRELWRWDLDSQQVKSVSGAWQYPTHVLVNGQNMWVLDSQRRSRVHCLSLPELKPLKVFELEGSSYAHQTDTPADLMHIEPEVGWLAVLTQVSLPDPYTPKLSVIHLNSGEIQTSQPSNRTWPALLATAHVNQALKELKQKQQQSDPTYGKEIPGVVQALLASFSLSMNKLGSSLLILNATAGPTVDLPSRTRDLILDDIREKLSQEQGVSFALPPRTEAEKEIVIHAERLAQLLRSHVQLDGVLHRLLGQHTIGFTLNRQTLLADLHAKGLISAALIQGIENTSIEEQTPELRPQFSTLPTGWLGLADPLNSRVMQLNADLSPVWLLDTSLFDVYRPLAAFWGDDSLVVLDGESGMIQSWQLKGKMNWSLESRMGAWNRMHLAPTSQNLVVLGLDSETGLLEAMNPTGQLLWTWSEGQGCPRVLDMAAGANEQVCLLHQEGKLSLVNTATGSVRQNLSLPGFPSVLAFSDAQQLAFFDGQVQTLHFLDLADDAPQLKSFNLNVSSDRYRIHQPLGLQWYIPNQVAIYDAYRLLIVSIETGEILSETLMQELQIKTGQKNLAPVDIFTALSERQSSSRGGTQHSLLEMLERVSLFQQAPDEFLAELAGLIRTRVFNRGDEIVRKGDHGVEMYLIRQGQVEVLGARLTDVVARMGPGDIFGEVALMLGQKRNASVRASSYCEVFSLQQSDLDSLLPFYPDVRDRLLQLAQERQLQEQLRSDKEQERMRIRIQELQEQRKVAPPVRRPAEALAHAILDPGVELTPLEVWVRHVKTGQIAQVDRQGQVLTVLGDLQRLMQPVKVLDTLHGYWVLDAGQNQLALFEPENLERKLTLSEWAGGYLEQPRDMSETASGSFWIANTGKAELLHLSARGELLQRLACGRAPASVVTLANGHLLVADMRLHTVTEISEQGDEIWSYGTPRKFGREENLLFAPEHAIRLENGNTLIADTGNSRVIELNPEGRIVWSLLSGTGLRMTRPTRVERLANGHTLLEHSNRSNWLEVNSQLIQAWRYAVPIEAFTETLK